jgi:hypothetical protein
MCLYIETYLHLDLSLGVTQSVHAKYASEIRNAQILKILTFTEHHFYLPQYVYQMIVTFVCCSLFLDVNNWKYYSTPLINLTIRPYQNNTLVPIQ